MYVCMYACMRSYPFPSLLLLDLPAYRDHGERGPPLLKLPSNVLRVEDDEKRGSPDALH